MGYGRMAAGAAALLAALAAGAGPAAAQVAVVAYKNVAADAYLLYVDWSAVGGAGGEEAVSFLLTQNAVPGIGFESQGASSFGLLDAPSTSEVTLDLGEGCALVFRLVTEGYAATAEGTCGERARELAGTYVAEWGN